MTNARLFVEKNLDERQILWQSIVGIVSHRGTGITASALLAVFYWRQELNVIWCCRDSVIFILPLQCPSAFAQPDHRWRGLLPMNVGYQNYLKSESWQNLRLKKLASKRGMCQLCCHPADKPQIHHTIYPKRLKEVSFQSLKVLCSECHMFVHEVLKMYKDEPILTFGNRRSKWDFVRCKALMIRNNKLRLPLWMKKQQ